MTGAESLVAALEAAGTEVVFGALPVNPVPTGSTAIRFVPVRHQQGAGHAAAGYALATGRVGVCMAASGHGVTDLVTSLADAFMDSVSIVAVIGPATDRFLGSSVTPETDTFGITMPVTKHNYTVTAADDVAPTIADAFRLASTGRTGPVVVDITRTALRDLVSARGSGGAEFGHPERDRPECPTTTSPVPGLNAAIEEIRTAERPVLYVGGGVIRSGASPELHRFVDATQIPVVTTLMARGALPDSHPRHLGMPGMHGTVPAVAALQLSDLIIALGARFDDRVTGDPETFAPHARVVHADIDPAEIGKNRAVDVGLIADCKDVLEALTSALPTGRLPDLTRWHHRLASLTQRYPLGYDEPTDGSLAPQFVISRLNELVGGPGTVFTTGVGQHQMWAAQFISFVDPSSWLTSGGLGTMGFGIPAAMGAKVARPEASVWCIDGDGCFQMTSRELATCALEGIPIKVALINNGSLGMVRQLQSLYYDDRVNNVDLTASPSSHGIPDFAMLADALGCVGLVCDSADQVDVTIAKAMAVCDLPVIIDFRVNRQALVWPSIAAGASNDDIQYARGLAPAFDTDE